MTAIYLLGIMQFFHESAFPEILCYWQPLNIGRFFLEWAKRVVHCVTNATARFWPRYIKFPTLTDEIKAKQIKFFDTARFPKVVDCTHVKKIQSFGK